MTDHQRSPLERWSWIAGIAGAIIAAVTLFVTLRTPDSPGESNNLTAGAGATQIGRVTGSVTINNQPTGPQTVLPLSHEIFWESITRGDVANIERLLKDGMKLKPAYLQDYFGHYYSPETFAVLERYGALPSAGCPVTASSPGFYLSVADNDGEARAVRQVCGTNAVIEALEKIRETVSKNNAMAVAARARLPATVAECKQRERARRSADAWYAAASQFVIVSVNSYSLEQEILAKLNVALLSGQVTARNMQGILTKTIDETCVRYNIPAKPDEQLEQSLQRALKVLKAD